MSRRVTGVLAAASAILVSWGALSEPRASGSPASTPNLMVAALRSGIAPAPADSAGHYLLQHPRASALFTDTGVAMRLPSRTLQARELGWSVVGGRAVKPQAEKPRAAKLQRRVGPPEAWERDVPTYGGLRYPGVLPGVELWFEERAEGLEYGFRAERGEDLRRVRLEYAGAREVRVVEEGRALEVELGEGVLREQGLWCAQEEADGSRREVGCRFADARPVGRERWEYAIAVDVEEPDRPVVVDPLVAWNTYLGSTGDDALRDIALNDAGDVFIVGTVGSQVLSPPADAGTRPGLGQSDVMVARFQGDGGLTWMTVLGGSEIELARAIELGSEGEVLIAGVTSSPNLAVNMPAGGLSSTLRGPTDGFVAQLDSSGRNIDWFMYFGSSGADQVRDIARTSTDRLALVGETDGGDLPGAAGDLTVTGTEAFVSVLDLQAPGSSAPGQGWSWLLKGSGQDVARAVAVTDTSVLVIGSTSSHDFARNLTPSLEGTYSGGTVSGGPLDAFITQHSLINGLVQWGTYFGGSGRDEGYDIAVDSARSRIVVTGVSESDRLPGTPSRDAGGLGVFVARYAYGTGSVSNVTLEATHRIEGTLALTSTVDLADGGIFVGGQAVPGFVAKGGFDSTLAGLYEGFVARVRLEDASPVQWSSLVGGNGADEVLALAVDGQRQRLLVGGATTSTDLLYTHAGFSLVFPGTPREMYLLSVDLRDVSVDAGQDAGVPDAGQDAGVPDAGQDAGPGGEGGEDGGTGRKPLLGWSLSCSTGDGPGALALGALVGLALLAVRRQRFSRQ